MQRSRAFVGSKVSDWSGVFPSNRPEPPGPPGATSATALAYPSDLVTAGVTSSGEFWLTGNGTTPYKVYCLYENGIMWARTTSIVRDFDLGSRTWYTYNLGSDYSLSNESTFTLAPSTFGNATGTNLSVMVRAVGGTFSGAIASTPGRRFSAIWRGINLQDALNSASTTSVASSSPAYSADGITFTAYTGSQLLHANNGWNLVISNSSSSDIGGYNHADYGKSGWILHGDGAGDNRAFEIYGRTDQNVALGGEKSWSRFEMYVTI